MNTKVASLILILALSITVATADETRNHQFPADDISTLTVDMRAGTILVEHTDDDHISIEVVLTEGDRSWFRRSINMDTMDIEVRQYGSELALSFDQKSVNSDWVIKVPALSRIEVNAGAGTVEINMAKADIDVNIGVGTIEFRLFKSLFGDIELTSGVGDTSVRGANSVESQRAFVSSELRAQGNGSLTARANVGVGSAEAELL